MPQLSAASSRDRPSKTSAIASIRRAALASRVRAASRRKSPADRSRRVIATAMSASAPGQWRSESRRPPKRGHVRVIGQGAWYQTVTLSLGEFGVAQGLTQFAGKELVVRNLEQDGVPLGAYAGISVRDNGDVAVNYDNGQSRVVARVPLVAFNDPDKLQRLDGQAFMRTAESGEARVTDSSSSGVGKLVAGSIERSNVDIATEFTKLIVAQRAYTANTRVVTT